MDKVYHGCVSALLVVAGWHFLHCCLGVGPLLTIVVSVVVALAIGFIKEKFVDAYIDRMDFLADVVGVAVGVGMVFGIRG
jgi:hypothetical protein